MPQAQLNTSSGGAARVLKPEVREALHRMNLRQSLRVNGVEFQPIRHVTLPEIENARPGEHRLLAQFREICRITRSTMADMNRSFPGLPPDPLMHTHSLVSREGALTAVLSGIDPAREAAGRRVLGYGIAVKGVANFPDAHNFPARLLRDPEAWRLIRLFVTSEARALLPEGEAFSRILNFLKGRFDKTPTLALVLTDIVPHAGEFAPGQTPRVWLEAKRALEARALEDAGSSGQLHKCAVLDGL